MRAGVSLHGPNIQYTVCPADCKNGRREKGNDELGALTRMPEALHIARSSRVSSLTPPNYYLCFYMTRSGKHSDHFILGNLQFIHRRLFGSLHDGSSRGPQLLANLRPIHSRQLSA